MDLSQFKQDNNAQGEKDTLGGGFIQDSDALEWTIEHAFLGKSEKGAMSFTIWMNNAEGKKYRETIYFTNREGKTFYERDGERFNLPGFNQVNAICLLVGRKPLDQMTAKKITLKLWNKDAGAEVPTEVDSLAELENQKGIFGILRVIEDKTSLNEATGKYEPTGETRETNTIDKVFRSGCMRTVSEIQACEEKGTFITQWLDKNKGQIINKAKGAKAGSAGGQMNGGGGAGKPPAGDNLFG